MSAITHLFAGVPVSDLDASIDWYTRFFGRPPRQSRRGRDALGSDERAWLFIEPNAARAGAGRITLAVAGFLYGCGRFGSLDDSLAHDLPRAGIATLYVDYFAETPPPAGGHGCCGGGGDARNVWATWHREVIDGAAALRRTSGIDPHRVGVVGWSMGGGVALDAAASAPAAGHAPRARSRRAPLQRAKQSSYSGRPMERPSRPSRSSGKRLAAADLRLPRRQR